MRFTALLITVLVAFALAANAHAVIGRADLDGASVNENFVGGADADSIAVNGGHLYWLTLDYDREVSTIGRANLDGTGVDKDIIEMPGVARGLAVDNQHIYWSNSTTNSIGRANLDGSNVDEDYIPSAAGNQARDVLYATAVDGDHIYWGWAGRPPSNSWIGRANLDGTGADKRFLSTETGSVSWGPPTALAVNAHGIYWAEGAVIGRADLDGTNVIEPFLTVCPPTLDSLGGCAASVTTITGLAADGSHVYFAGLYQQPPGYHDYANAIGRASDDAAGIFEISPVTTLAARPPSPPRGLAVDSSHVYWGRGTTILRGSVSAKRVQEQQGSRVVVKAEVKARESLFASAEGRVHIKANAYPLKSIKFTEVSAGTSMVLRLKPDRSDTERIIKALKSDRKATARLKVRLGDRDGNRESRTLSIRLKRP